MQPENVEHIADLWGPQLGISEAAVREYLTRYIQYSLDEDARGGLELFYQYAADCGLIAAAPQLRFLGPASCLEPPILRNKSA